MAFSQASITSVSIARDHGELVVSWTSSAAAGTMFQVYVDGVLSWWGTERACHLTLPGEAVRIDVGTVAAGESRTDFSSSLPSLARPRRAALTWYGGTYEADDIASYRVRGETTPGGGIQPAILATIPAYDGEILDGAGIGPAGYGGAGRAASEYSWTSAPLSGGTWNWSITPVDVAGNEGSATTASLAIAAPPNPPAPFADGKRLHLSYDATAHTATLTWQASP